MYYFVVATVTLAILNNPMASLAKPSPENSAAYIRQGGNPPMGEQLISGLAGVDPGLGLSIGVRYSLRLVRHGFIRPINNSVALELCGFVHSPSDYQPWTRVYSGGGMRWDFHVHRDWTPYGLLEGGVRLPLESEDRGRLVAGAAIGIFYHLDSDMELRVEAGGISRAYHIGLGWHIL